MTYEKRWDEKSSAGIRWEELRWDEGCSVKCGARRVQCEVWSVKYEVWSVKCEVWSVKCEVWSVDCEGCSVKCEVLTAKGAVWSVKSVECEVRRVQCEECSVKCAVWSVKTVKCEVWSGASNVTCETRHQFRRVHARTTKNVNTANPAKLNGSNDLTATAINYNLF